MTWDNLPGKPRERSLTFFATMAFHSSRLATGAQTRMAFTAKADLANKLDRVNDRYSPPTCDDARRARCLEKWARTMLWIGVLDRKRTRLNSSHGYISYAVFCLKKKKKNTQINRVESTDE